MIPLIPVVLGGIAIYAISKKGLGHKGAIFGKLLWTDQKYSSYSALQKEGWSFHINLDRKSGNVILNVIDANAIGSPALFTKIVSSRQEAKDLAQAWYNKNK